MAVLRLLFAWMLSFVVAACSSPPPPVPSPGIDGYDDARLQALVHSGLRFMVPGPCRMPWLLGVLDDDESGARLDKLLERAADSDVEADCIEVIAAARIVRLGRLGTLDLRSEMTSPSPVVRAVALRYALGTQSSAVQREIVALALADGTVDVRIVAYRAAAALGDTELVATLVAVTPVDETEEFWRCTALSRLRSSVTCPEPSTVREVVPAGDVEPVDRCDQARADVTTPQRRNALWFYLASAFRQRVEPLDRIAASQSTVGPCLLDEAVEDEILSSNTAPVEDQAIIAAALLWRRHEPVGLVRDRRIELREMASNDAVRSCSSSRDCPRDSDCFRPPGRGRKGLCGTPGSMPDDRRPRVYFTLGSNACWSFMDCPAFYSCYYPDPRSAYGVCVR